MAVFGQHRTKFCREIIVKGGFPAPEIQACLHEEGP